MTAAAPGHAWHLVPISMNLSIFAKMKEKANAPLPQGSYHQDRGDFTFGGHRLSSLYRGVDLIRTILRLSESNLLSSLQKYSKSTAATQRNPGGYAP